MEAPCFQHKQDKNIKGELTLKKVNTVMEKTRFERFFITPGIKCLSAAMLLAACLMSSCSDDDEDTKPQNINLETPAYEDVSAKYDVTSGGGGISSIELTASGNYVITMEGAAYVPAALSPRNMMKSFTHAAANGTRADEGYICGKFVKISDTEFILEGFGSIVIDGAAGNAFSIQVTKSEGETYTLNAEKAATVSNSEMSNALCRTWDINTMALKGTFNGRDFYNNEQPAAQYNQMWAGLNSAFAKLLESITGETDDEGFFEVPETSPVKQVIFTKSGSYMVMTEDSQLGIAEWAWKNEKNGIITYSNPRGSNDAEITFSGKEMSLTEVNFDMDETEEGMRFQLKVQTTYKCTEMK